MNTFKNAGDAIVSLQKPSVIGPEEAHGEFSFIV